MAEFEYDIRPETVGGPAADNERSAGGLSGLVVAARQLELALQDAPLEDILGGLVTAVEASSASGVLGSILLLDDSGRHLRHGAAPSLPRAYCEAIDGIAIGPSVGSCGTAAHRGEPVLVEDIAADPLWAEFSDLAVAHGLRSCWSTPIRSSQGKILGTFAMYYRQPRQAEPKDLQVVDFVTRTAALVIQRKSAEESLRLGEQRFRTVFENAGVGMLELDGEWNILGANQVYADITGRPKDSLIGLDCLSFTHADDIERSRDAMRTIAQGRADRLSFEKRYLRPDGEEVWIRSNLARVSSGKDGERFLKIVEDITDAKIAARALEEERRTLETLNRIGASLAGELDLERVVQMVTEAGVELSGAQFGAFFYNVTDPVGESVTQCTLAAAGGGLLEGLGMPDTTAAFRPTFDGDSVVRSDDIGRDPSCGNHVPHPWKPEAAHPVRSFLAVPLTGRTGEVMGGLYFGHSEPARFNERHERLIAGIAAQAAIAIDNAGLFRDAQREIDQRMKAEQALTALNETLETRVVEEIARRSHAEEALRQSQKMETIGQLSGGIAHDFNNLLQIIHGNLSILQQSVPAGEEKWQRSIANALKGAERAAGLTQRLLAFSRRQPLDAKAIDVNRLIADMSELLHRTLGETVDVRTVLRPGIRAAQVDRNQLENALLNLAINARDAMPDGGALTVETAETKLDESYTRTHPEVQPGSYVRISVCDTGEGMNEATLARAIEPFFTTKEVGKGTGLGLSMVYGFVTQSGGHLSLESEAGAGTKIHLYLPPASDRQKDREVPGHEGKLPLGNGETILVCEDDEDVRRFSVETLTDLGYAVVEAEDAASALAALRRNGRVDLLFTDVVLPGGVTGADLAREAQALQPGLKILFTTGYARSALDDEEGRERGIELLSKPFGIRDLAVRLRRLLQD